VPLLAFRELGLPSCAGVEFRKESVPFRLVVGQFAVDAVACVSGLRRFSLLVHVFRTALRFLMFGLQCLHIYKDIKTRNGGKRFIIQSITMQLSPHSIDESIIFPILIFLVSFLILKISFSKTLERSSGKS